jgi:L-amino acid N-acyltransferase YncA
MAAMVKIKYEDMASAFEFVSAGAPMEHSAYVSRDSGNIYWVSDLVDSEEELPEDLETSDRYLAVPHKNDLDLGRYLVTRFVRQAIPDSEPEVEAIFRRRGAYGRFKDLLDAKGQLDAWYRFEEAAQEEALHAWCADNDIEMSDNPRKKPTQASPAKPRIRTVTVADATAIVAIYNPYVQNTVITFEQAQVPKKEMAKRIEEYTALYPWLVAEADGKVVAYAYATRWRTRAAYDQTLESTIYVDKDYTGRGIAKPLYLELLRQLKTAGVHAVVGCIALPNDASVALHEKCGFVKVAHFPQVGRKFERRVDVGFWQVTLAQDII